MFAYCANVIASIRYVSSGRRCFLSRRPPGLRGHLGDAAKSRATLWGLGLPGRCTRRAPH